MADPRGALGTTLPTSYPNFFVFRQFSSKMEPPCLVNSGSATESIILLKTFPCAQRDTLQREMPHPAGGSISSDWFLHSFIMVVCENFLYSSIGHKILTELRKKFLTDNHYETIYEPVCIDYLPAACGRRF